MCELFAINTSKKLYVNEYLKVFYSHSNVHKDGWGLAIFNENNISLEKESIIANDSILLKEILSKPMIEKNVLAHIRLASRGINQYENSHPFILKDYFNQSYIFMHNGTIFDETLTASYQDVQKGSTDSERAFYYVMDCINNNKTESFEEKFSILENAVVSLSEHNKFNMMLFDGKTLFVHTNYKNTLYMLKKEEGYIISTTKLSDEDWEEVPFLHVCAFQNGTLVKIGNKQSFEYIKI